MVRIHSTAPIPTQFREIATPDSRSPLCLICAVAFYRDGAYGAKAFRVRREVIGRGFPTCLRTSAIASPLSGTQIALRAFACSGCTHANCRVKSTCRHCRPVTFDARKPVASENAAGARAPFFAAVVSIQSGKKRFLVSRD